MRWRAVVRCAISHNHTRLLVPLDSYLCDVGNGARAAQLSGCVSVLLRNKLFVMKSRFMWSD